MKLIRRCALQTDTDSTGDHRLGGEALDGPSALLVTPGSMPRPGPPALPACRPALINPDSESGLQRGAERARASGNRFQRFLSFFSQ